MIEKIEEFIILCFLIFNGANIPQLIHWLRLKNASFLRNNVLHFPRFDFILSVEHPEKNGSVFPR